MLWSLLELFVNMDLARMSELNVDKCMHAFGAAPWNMGVDRPGDISNGLSIHFSSRAYTDICTSEFYTKLALQFEHSLYMPLVEPDRFDWHRYVIIVSAACSFVFRHRSIALRLFFFRYNYVDADPVPTPFDDRLDMCVVKVDARGTPGYNDLLSCLSSELFPERHLRSQAIFQPSEVVAFQLVRSHAPGVDREVFSFPPYLYLDQFLKENAELAGEKRRMQWELTAEIERLSQRRSDLTRHEVFIRICFYPQCNSSRSSAH